MQSPEWSDRQMRKANGGLQEIARRLGESPYCVNNTFGLADIAVVNFAGSVVLQMATGASEFFPLSTSFTAMVQADFNSDGFPDLAVSNQTDGTVSVYLNVCSH